jgi:peroxiredoxin
MVWMNSVQTVWPYPAPKDDGAAAHLVAGVALPDVELPTTTGDRLSLAKVSGLSIVFVYPWTGRSGQLNPPGWDNIAGAHGSTPEALGFEALIEHYKARGIQILGLSTQPRDWQREFAGRVGLTYPLLSDANFQVADLLRLPSFEVGGTRYLKRLTLMCRDGMIVRTFYPVHPPDRHAADLLAML